MRMRGPLTTALVASRRQRIKGIVVGPPVFVSERSEADEAMDRNPPLVESLVDEFEEEGRVEAKYKLDLVTWRRQRGGSRSFAISQTFQRHTLLFKQGIRGSLVISAFTTY